MRIVFTLAGLLVFLYVSPQTAFEKRAKETYFNNGIKSQINWDYVYTGNKPARTGIKTSLTIYTSAGDIEQVTTYNPKGQVINIEKYKYDTNGNRAEYSRYPGGNQSKAAYQKISKYNEKSLLLEESGYDGVENFMNIYKYDVQGNMVEIRYMKNNVLSEKRIFTRDGNTTNVSVYNASGNLASKLMLQYDSGNNLIEETAYGINQSELEKKTYHYDENKNLKEEAKYKQERITLKTSYNYNSSSELLDIFEESPGNSKFLKKGFTYDSKGNLLEIRWRRKGNEEFNRITYTYDSRGICTTSDTWYPATQYRVLTKYMYETY